ncbi:MAG: hypothetical protein PHR35_04035, partial [Kiritimatiellae bacterium]|nr:hypothetical protein [Kiritimatiellia bacterium]
MKPSTPKTISLKTYAVNHAGRRTILHPELEREIHAQTAVTYLRFLRLVRVARLDLPLVNYGRWVPNVPTHPAHVMVSVLDRAANRWKVIADVELAPNAKCAGESLTQEMAIEEMEAHFRKAMAEQVPHGIELGSIETDLLRVECDREHPVWPNHGECNGGPYNVPFGILHQLSAVGEELGEVSVPPYRRKLSRGVCNPIAPEGMTLDTRNPLELVFSGDRLRVGFSLIRPMLTQLDWNHFGDRPPAGNRLFFRGSFGSGGDALGGQNGPSYITATGTFVPQNMTGTVEATGNRVTYRGIATGTGITVNAVFSITAEALTVEFEQEAETDLPVIEGEVWRLLWNMRSGLTGMAAVPLDREGRNGFVELPALIAADSGGCLAVRLLEGNGNLHTESYRCSDARSTGFVLATADTPNTPLMIPRGRQRAVFELRPCALLPASAAKEATLSEGVRKCWTAGFSAFRPEFGGFSNNAISTNCHVNQHTAFDFAAFTARPSVGPDPLDLVKFSVGRALLDGGGYGYHRRLYLDSDPILLCGAGRIVQLADDRAWLTHVGPGIRAAARRILDSFDPREGMIVCRSLSGNAGTYRWSSNAMDVVGFGHIDAYVNAWSFRGLKNAAALCARLGDVELTARCAEAAAALAANYARQLVNPATGWVSGWRSRDGKLHDYGFIWVNGVACAFGVMEPAIARQALTNLEAMRREVFPESGYVGLPLNLLPIAPEDHMLPRLGYQTKPTYENYTDGALSPFAATYYLRALSRNGLAAEARAIADSLEHGFAGGMFHGPYGTGKEFMTWTGADSGYEGTFGPNSGPLYAIAVERGVITPPNPEWWLTDEEDNKKH